MQINISNRKTLLLSFLSNPNVIGWGKRILFTAGILLFTLVQLTMVVRPIMSRTAPVETDDAYTYILKAAQMQGCFLQNCPALNDLREQLTAPSQKLHISWARYREYVRAFSIYHPLHSLILTGLHVAGLSWEVSYNVVEVVGSLFLSLTISYWLYRLFGVGPAGIALLLLAFTPFPNQGLHYVVPSNLALGIGMLTWASLLQEPKRPHRILIVSTLALVLMHPIGRLYAFLSIFLFILLNARQMKRPDWLISGLSILIVVTTFFLPLIIHRPELSFPSEPPPADWNIRSGYYNNIKEAASFVSSWMHLYGGFPMAVLFIFVGLMSLPPLEQRTRIVITMVLLGGLLCASLFQVLPRYPAEAFSRIWIPFTIFLTGLIAHGIGRWASAVMHWGRQLLQSGIPDFRDEGRILSMPGWTALFLLIFGLVLARNSVQQVIDGQRIFREVLQITIDSQDSSLVTEQPLILLKSGCKDVLYMFEVPMHLYFAHGALACGAAYHPALVDTPEEAQWIQNNPNLGYVVTWNPTIKATVTTGGNPLALETGDRLEFYIPEDWTSQQLYVYLENPGGDTQLGISPLQMVDGEKPKIVEHISIPANWSGWQAVDIAADELVHGFSLDAAQVSHAIYLRGIKSDPNSSRNWPWDQDVTLVYQPSGSDADATEINFNIANLIPYANWALTVVDDQGDTVLIKVNR
jgi:hypothetical protein